MEDQDQKRERKPLVRLTGLWATKTKTGEKMLSGNLGGARVLILANKHKRAGSKDPDYSLCVTEPEPLTSGKGALDDGGDAGEI